MAKAIDVNVQREPATHEPPDSYFIPATDVYETADELVLVADMPGVRADGLEVTVEDHVLVIRGAPRPEADAAGETRLAEFVSGEFYRAFRLPADFDTDKVEARMKDGVLTLRLPKAEHLKPRRIEVKAG